MKIEGSNPATGPGIEKMSRRLTTSNVGEFRRQLSGLVADVGRSADDGGLLGGTAEGRLAGGRLAGAAPFPLGDGSRRDEKKSEEENIKIHFCNCSLLTAY